jgi:spore coat protein JC
MHLFGGAFSMPQLNKITIFSSLDVEELGHLEMIGTLVYQLTRNLSIEDIKKGEFDAWQSFVHHI